MGALSTDSPTWNGWAEKPGPMPRSMEPGYMEPGKKPGFTQSQFLGKWNPAASA